MHVISVCFLVELYTEGESTFVIDNDDKIINVIVNRKRYTLSADAFTAFENIHDDWEIECLQKVPLPAINWRYIIYYIILYFSILQYSIVYYNTALSQCECIQVNMDNYNMTRFQRVVVLQ